MPARVIRAAGRYACRMSPSTSRPGIVRSAAVVNEDIRALVRTAGGYMYGETRERYEELVAEWAEAVRAEVVEAA